MPPETRTVTFASRCTRIRPNADGQYGHPGAYANAPIGTDCRRSRSIASAAPCVDLYRARSEKTSSIGEDDRRFKTRCP